MEKRLYRSPSEKMIAGVAGGIAEYFGIDPVLTRIGFVALVFVHGIGILLYVLLWIITPKRPAAVSDAQAASAAMGDPTAAMNPFPSDAPGEGGTDVPGRTRNARGSAFIGILFILVGLLIFLGNVIPGFCFESSWPLILIALGVVLLWPALKKT